MSDSFIDWFLTVMCKTTLKKWKSPWTFWLGLKKHCDFILKDNTSLFDPKFYNCVYSYSKAFGQLKKLEWLNLASNSLNVMDDNALGNLHSLLHLNMAHNRFVALPSDLFHEAKYLQVWIIYKCHILHNVLMLGWSQCRGKTDSDTKPIQNI